MARTKDLKALGAKTISQSAFDAFDGQATPTLDTAFEPYAAQGSASPQDGAMAAAFNGSHVQNSNNTQVLGTQSGVEGVLGGGARLPVAVTQSGPSMKTKDGKKRWGVWNHPTAPKS